MQVHGMQAQMWSNALPPNPQVPPGGVVRGKSPGIQQASAFVGSGQNSMHQVPPHIQMYQQPQGPPWSFPGQFNLPMQAATQSQGFTEPSWSYPAHIRIAQRPLHDPLHQTSNQQWNYPLPQGGDRQNLPTIYEKGSE